MGEPGRRGAIGAVSGDPPGGAPSLVPDHLPLARAASVIAVVVLAGALFGYDQGVISGALQFMAKDLHLGTTLQEVVTSWVTLGALVGALLAGGLADRLGRRRGPSRGRRRR